MMDAALLVVARNRAPQVRVAMGTIVARGYDIPVVFVDDASTDGLQGALDEAGFDKIESRKFVRLERDGGYRRNPSAVLNRGHEESNGASVVVEQGGEVAHLNDCVTPLVSACRPGIIALARVHNGTVEEMHHVQRALKDGTYLFPEDVVSANPMTDAEHWRPGIANVGGRDVRVFCGTERRVPFLFLGAIHKEDFEAVGGYNEERRDRNDEDLAHRLTQRGVTWRWLGRAVAWHLKHGKS